MIEFEYKGKTFFTTNLDKKLKRLKADIKDINIITKEIESKPIENEEVKSVTIYFFNKNTLETYITVENPKIDITPYLINEDVIRLEGKPIYPIKLKEDGTPEIER
jgi:hypothetical protein